MAQWKFNQHRPGDVEIEVTQRDQFRDDVGLAEALVREVVQNSLDAAASEEPVRVRFALETLENARAGAVSRYLTGLRPHLEASRDQCAVEPSKLDERRVRVLVVEDFGTTGLTGRHDALDDGNFRNFWRRHGRSSKGGAKGGRWGLGKLVFSIASEIRAFFGLTLREGDASPLLMGQAVLAYHRIGQTEYVPHGFWFEREGPDGLQLPITDADFIRAFCSATGVTRGRETGFSVVVPHVTEWLDEQALIRGVVGHCYFPILAGHLVVEVGKETIDQDRFLEIATGAGNGDPPKVPFQFVQEISRRLRSEPDFRAVKAIGRKPLGEDFFEAEDLRRMREQYTRGELVHVGVPVCVQRKGKGKIRSEINLFLRRLRGSEKPFSVFARGPIVLARGRGRSYFSGPAMGALVARGKQTVAEFLGDAENPAHTHWIADAERLLLNWERPGWIVTNIRHSLRNLFDLVAEESREVDETSLAEFFPAPEPIGTDRGREPVTPEPHPEPPRRDRAFKIQKREGGFEILPGPGAGQWTFPGKIRMRVAYDIIGADPFKRHSPFDFDLRKKEISLRGRGVQVRVPKDKANVLIVEVTEPDFSLQARGFDTNRDLVVDAREVA